MHELVRTAVPFCVPIGTGLVVAGIVNLNRTSSWFGPNWVSYSIITSGGLLIAFVGLPLAILTWRSIRRNWSFSRNEQQLGQVHGRVPPRPPHYIPRPGVIDALKQLLLEERGTVAVSGAHKVQALQGMGGVGKTVLVADLIEDEDVRSAFPDGLFWITVGRDRDLVTLQNRLVTMLDSQSSTISDLDIGRERIRELTNGKRCLVVLDDVWQYADVDSLDSVGDQSRVIITTRDVGLVEQIGASEYSLSELVEQDALDLLSKASGFERNEIPDIAREVASECGYLPLALAVVGSVINAQSDMWGYVLDALRQGDLDKFEADFPQYPYPHVFAAIEVSVDALGTDAARYVDLAVFQEDALIPETALRVLWRPLGLDEIQVRRLVTQFASRSLCTITEDGHLILHDLQGDYIRNRGGNRGLPGIHQRLVESYEDECQGNWASHTNDGYYFQNLIYHMARSGRMDEARSLLLSYDWMTAKLHHTDVNQLIGEFDLVAADQDMALVQSAIRLSAHIVSEDHSQLSGQLVGRLPSHQSEPIEGLLDQLYRYRDKSWIRPMIPSLSVAGGALLRTLSGHSGLVTAVSVTSDGTRAVSGSSDGTLKLWDLESDEELATLSGHSGLVTAVSVTSDGTRAVSGSDDGTLKLWDLESDEELATLSGHSDWVSAVSLTSDGTRAVSGSDDGTLKLWDLESGEELATLSGHGDSVSTVSLTSDGTRAVSGSHDGTLKLWDLESGEELATFSGHSGLAMAVSVTPDGTRAVSGSYDGTLKLWDPESGEELATFSGHSGVVRTVSVTSDGTRAVSGSDDRTLKLWDLESGEELATLSGHSGAVRTVSVTSDGTRAVSGSDDRTLKLWDLESGEEPSTLSGHSGLVRAVSVTSDGTRAVSGSDDGTLKLWDLESGEELATLSGHSGLVRAVSVTSDGTRAVSGSDDGTLKLWDLESGEELATLSGHFGLVTAVSVTPDGTRAVLGSHDGTLKLWDLESGEELATFSGHNDWVRSVSLTSDGTRAVSGSDDRTLRLWDLESGEELATLSGHSDWVRAVSLTSDGTRAVSGSDDRTLKLWDLESGEELATFSGHSDSVSTVSLTSDGTRAVSGSDDGTLKLWDLESGKEIATFTADAAISTCGVGLGGRLFIAGDQGGSMHFLRLMGD